MEAITHTLGFCGEPHGSILMMLMGTSPELGYIIFKFKMIINYLNPIKK